MLSHGAGGAVTCCRRCCHTVQAVLSHAAATAALCRPDSSCQHSLPGLSFRGVCGGAEELVSQAEASQGRPGRNSCIWAVGRCSAQNTDTGVRPVTAPRTGLLFRPHRAAIPGSPHAHVLLPFLLRVRGRKRRTAQKRRTVKRKLAVTCPRPRSPSLTAEPETCPVGTVVPS